MCSNQENSCYMTTFLLSHRKLDDQDMLGMTGEESMNSPVMFSDGLLNMDTPVLANQQKTMGISSVQTLGAV